MVGSTEYFSKESLPATKHSSPNTLGTTTNLVEPPGAPLYAAELFKLTGRLATRTQNGPKNHRVLAVQGSLWSKKH